LEAESLIAAEMSELPSNVPTGKALFWLLMGFFITIVPFYG